MKKLIILCFMTCFMTGCSVNYTLKFNDKVLSETIHIDATSSNMTKEEIQNMLQEQMGQESSYQIKQNNKKIKLSQKYSTKEYQNSPLLKQCYTAYNFIENEDSYDLTTSNTFTCNPFEYMEIDTLKIQVKTNHKVLSHNADTVINNTYIWNITKENAGNKPIQIRFSKQKKTEYLGLIILGISVIIAVFIAVIVSTKNKNNNKI